MDDAKQKQQKEFLKELRDLLKANEQINLPPKMEILKLEDLPDLTEWRKN